MYVSWSRHNFLPRAPLDYDYILSSPLSPYLSVPDCVCTGGEGAAAATRGWVSESLPFSRHCETETESWRGEKDSQQDAGGHCELSGWLLPLPLPPSLPLSLPLSLPPLSPSLSLSLPPLSLSSSFSLPWYMYILCYFLHNILVQVAGLKIEWREEMKRMKQTHQKEIGTIRDKVCKSLSATKEKQ